MNLPTLQKELFAYTGNVSQVFYAQRVRLTEGKGDGVDAVVIDNGGGLVAWVLPGRGMDIGRLSYQGTNLGFLSKGGFSHFACCDGVGNEGIRTFAGGFLTTCGLRNVGPANTCDGEEFGFHGRIGQTPADEVSIVRNLREAVPYIEVSGRVSQGALFGACMELYRRIRFYYRRTEIEIYDTVTNWSDRSDGCMLLYHFNMGYPFLNAHSTFITGNRFCRPCDENAARGVKERYTFQAPTPGEPEQCFDYAQVAADDGLAFAACWNPDRKLGVMVQSDPRELPYMCNWQTWRTGDYAMGIEPGNCYTDGRSNGKERGELEILPAYGSKQTMVRVSILDGEDAMAKWKQKARQDG